MNIDHIALWTNDLERLKEFYETYFQAIAGIKYQNSARQFESYFLNFSSGARLELMSQPGLTRVPNEDIEQLTGYIHISFACGSEKSVDSLTDRLHNNGFQVVDSPRFTGDGYYESVVLDPDGNRIEITV